MRLRYILFILGLVLLSGCQTIAVSELDAESFENTTLTIETYFDSCVKNSYGDDCYVVQKFGHSENIGTSIVPVALGNVYQTPTTLQTLEILSSSANDDIAGIGARQVMIIGLSTNWTQVSEIVNMSGTTPVTLSNQFYRVYRVVVYTSGTYASAIAGSHQGSLTVRNSGGGVTWALISNSPFPLAQSEIGSYTVPNGYHAYIGNSLIYVDGNKEADVYFFKRNNASDVIAAYSPMRILNQVHGLTGTQTIFTRSYQNDISPTTDIGFMAETQSGTAGIGVNFEILLIKD